MSRTIRAALAALLAAPLAAAPLAAAAQGPAAKGPAAQGAGKTEVTWYGHATFTVRTPGGTVLAIDPWFSNPKAPEEGLAGKLERVDFVLVTHGHNDHVGDAIALGERTGAKLITSADLGRALVAAGYPEKQAGLDTLGNIGGAIQAGDATVIMVPASHGSSFSHDKAGHRDGGSPMGFVIQVKGGPTLYHTGDTDVIGDMRLIPERHGPVDVMLACIGGHFTMDPRGAALAASYVRPRIIVPMHFGTFPVLTGTPKDLEAALRGKSKARVQVLEPGKPVMF